MDIHFRVISNTPDETSMGQKYWFQPAVECDAISATANAPGFTPLVAVARHFGWNYRMLEAAASACNDKGEVAIVTSVEPTLFPETEIAGIITEILNPRVRVTLQKLVFDIDVRAESSLYGLMRPKR